MSMTSGASADRISSDDIATLVAAVAASVATVVTLCSMKPLTAS